MPRITLEEQPEFATLPENSILHLKIDDITVKDVEGRNGNSWQKLEYKFKVLGVLSTGDNSPVEAYDSLIGQHIWGSVPFRLTDHPENKLRQWAEAIFGMDLGVGFELDTDNMLRREVRGVTSQYEKRAKDPKTGQPYKAHQVESLLAMGGGTPTPVQTPQDPWASQPQPQTASTGAGFSWGGGNSNLPQAQPQQQQWADPGF